MDKFLFIVDVGKIMKMTIFKFNFMPKIFKEQITEKEKKKIVCIYIYIHIYIYMLSTGMNQQVKRKTKQISGSQRAV